MRTGLSTILSAVSSKPCTAAAEATVDTPKLYTSQGSPKFTLSVPSKNWVTAFDRTSKQSEGTVFLVGNFNVSTTASVSLLKPSGLDLPIESMRKFFNFVPIPHQLITYS